ncbi:MAG: thioredoxin-dependent thiol peroxidase [SAR202 cluster bacterium]|nr:thioredoxin-dependent thiol peroxidase [SAR202 cluster bacterium]|tara:strand:+ start:40311 stop:40772 length:462 start_codon:yes stop_codon:yes gene_type:complete
MTLKEGDIAPAFSLPASNGENVSLNDYKGKKVVIYFYPKDDTPGCTIEACNFRDDYSEITEAGAVILGVSKDDIKSHNKFINKFDLPFLLLSDESTEMISAYGAWVKKKMYGKEYYGVFRKTYLIDEEGKIQRIWPKVDVKTHSKEIIELIKN